MRHVFLQVLGTVPTISINKTEGCQVYLSKDSVSCDIVSAKSSEMNIMIPEGEGDYVSNRDKGWANSLHVCSCSYTLFLFSFFLNRGSSQCRSSSRLCGMEPNWWQNPRRSQADFVVHRTQIYFRPPDVIPQTYSAVKSTFPLHNFFCIVVTCF